MYTYAKTQAGTWVVMGEASDLVRDVGCMVQVRTKAGATKWEVIESVGKTFTARFGALVGKPCCYGYPDRSRAARAACEAMGEPIVSAPEQAQAARATVEAIDAVAYTVSASEVIEASKRQRQRASVGEAVATVTDDSWEAFKAQLLGGGMNAEEAARALPRLLVKAKFRWVVFDDCSSPFDSYALPVVLVRAALRAAKRAGGTVTIDRHRLSVRWSTKARKGGLDLRRPCFFDRWGALHVDAKRIDPADYHRIVFSDGAERVAA